MAKNRALTIKVERDEMVIRIGVNALRNAAEAHKGFSDHEGERLRIFNATQFARELAGALVRKEADETTFIQAMFDKAFRPRPRCLDARDIFSGAVVKAVDCGKLAKKQSKLPSVEHQHQSLREERARAKEHVDAEKWEI